MNAFPLQTYHHYYFFNSVDFSPSCLLEKITNYVKGSVFYHSSAVANLKFQPGEAALKNVSCDRLTCLMRPNRTLKYIELEHRIMHVIKPSESFLKHGPINSCLKRRILNSALVIPAIRESANKVFATKNWQNVLLKI